MSAIKICHFSDWHLSERFDQLPEMKLPEADMYICSGDMLPNFPTIWCEQRNGEELPWRPFDGNALGHWEYEGAKYPGGPQIRREIDPVKELLLQELWMLELKKSYGSFQVPNKDAPIVCIRGNHDFTNLTSLFSGENSVFEFTKDNYIDVINICGLKVAGMPGIPRIVGEWSDELYDVDMQKRVDLLSDDFDLLVTHTPPQNILDDISNWVDYSTGIGRPMKGFGSRPLASKLNRLSMQGKKFLHCFGHVHDSSPRTMRRGDILFSNAATGMNMLNWSTP